MYALTPLPPPASSTSLILEFQPGLVVGTCGWRNHPLLCAFIDDLQILHTIRSFEKTTEESESKPGLSEGTETCKKTSIVETERTGQTPHGIDVRGEFFGTRCLAGRYTSPSSDTKLSTRPSNSSVRRMQSTSSSLSSTLENPCHAQQSAVITDNLWENSLHYAT